MKAARCKAPCDVHVQCTYCMVRFACRGFEIEDRASVNSGNLYGKVPAADGSATRLYYDTVEYFFPSRYSVSRPAS